MLASDFSRVFCFDVVDDYFDEEGLREFIMLVVKIGNTDIQEFVIFPSSTKIYFSFPCLSVLTRSPNLALESDTMMQS